ncbi:hypothetical protein [Phenylobacterium sp.]|jgi:hypothetical protein|uniref:hypothetical protein n=1 Tax=Phenylobacterium sp. TaxID=1871053 RepID=UPI0037C73E47
MPTSDIPPDLYFPVSAPYSSPKSASTSVENLPLSATSVRYAYQAKPISVRTSSAATAKIDYGVLPKSTGVNTREYGFFETSGPIEDSLLAHSKHDSSMAELHKLSASTAVQAARVEQLAVQLERLTGAVHQLATDIRHVPSRGSEDSSFVPAVHALVEAASVVGLNGADLANLARDRRELEALFNFVADEQRPIAGLASEAEAELKAEDSRIRAAAARALALLDPERAKAVLPDSIENEKSRMTAAIMSGALNAAMI